jgi:hypothetical protein
MAVLLTAAAVTALKGALSKAVLFAATQDSKWWTGLFSRLSVSDQSLYTSALREVQNTYGLPPMDAAKAKRIMETAPFEIKRAQEKAAAGDAPAVQARYAKAFAQVLQEAISWTEANVPAAANKKWYQNPVFLIGGAATLLFLVRRK